MDRKEIDGVKATVEEKLRARFPAGQDDNDIVRAAMGDIVEWVCSGATEDDEMPRDRQIGHTVAATYGRRDTAEAIMEHYADSGLPDEITNQMRRLGNTYFMFFS